MSYLIIMSVTNVLAELATMQGENDTESFLIGGFSFDPKQGVLNRGRQQTVLRPKALALLGHLAHNRGRVVLKSELMDAVWPGIYVTEDSLTQSIREVRKALGDDEQALVRTIARRGYLLAADAEAETYAADGPVVAVLRFGNETGDASQDPMIDGFAEDIIGGLARFKTVTVMARQSSFAFGSDRPADWSNAHSQFGADYLIGGSIRRTQRNLRVSVSLIDAKALTEVWTERYETDCASAQAIEEAIVETTIGRLATRLEVAGLERARRKSARELAAHELMLRGVYLLRGNNPADYLPAQRLLEQAVEKDPTYGVAYAHLAFARVMVAGFGRAQRSDLDQALVPASRGVELAPDQPVGHRVLSFVQMYRREYAAAEYHLRRALELNPYDVENVEQMGYLLTLRGRPAEALEWIDRAVKLNPIHPPWYDHDRAFALYSLGEYRAAATAIERTPVPPAWMRTWLAACYAQMGELETARHHAARIVEADPDFSAVDFARKNGVAFEHAADNDHFAEGVFLALGLPI